MSKPTGIVERHSRSCPSRTGGECAKPCRPSYEAWVWSPRDGRKIRKSFPTLTAAKGWRTDALHGLRRGTFKAPTRRTLKEAAEVWLDGAKAGAILTRGGAPFKPSVIRGYEADLKHHVYDDLGALRLSELRRSDIQALVDRLVKDGKSASKIHNIVMPLRTICRHALERDEIIVNPTANLRLPTPTGKRDRVATPTEAEELLEALPVEDRTLWATAVYAGLRRGELRALRWSDVDLAENVVSVSRSWDEKEGPVAPKSAKGTRRTPIPAVLRRYLIEHKMRTGRDGDDLVFGRTPSDPFTPTHVRKQALKAWAKANADEAERAEEEDRDPKVLEPIGLHELRHTYVSIMHDAGFSLERIGDYVGHSSAYMTDCYRHLLDGHEAEAASRLDEYLERAAEQADGR
jgi:integrase